MNETLFRKDVNHKTPGWYLKSKDIELFLTEDGGQHAPVTFRRNTAKPIQPYFISPWQDQRPDLSAAPLLQNLRGDFFCLPFGGNGDPVDGRQYPPHGETAAFRWELVKAEAQGSKTVFEFAMTCSVSGAEVLKHIEMQEGTDALYLAHTISGLDGRMPYGHHTIIQMPEENETMFFSVGKFDFGMTCPGVFASPVNLEYQYLASGEEFSSISQHLNVLKKAHVVECDKRGKHVFYRLAYPCIPWMIRFMEARDEFNRLSPEEKNVCMEQQRKQLIDHLMQLKG